MGVGPSISGRWIPIALTLAIGWMLAAAPAFAHGGRIRQPKVRIGPGGALPPGATPMGQPPPTAGPPTTPPPQPPPVVSPKLPLPPTTGGRNRSRPGPSTSGWSWQTWWDLNRWAYFPDRGALARAGRPVTLTGRPPDPALHPDRVLERKRAVICRDMIQPFLLQRLDPQRRERPEVVAAASLALARSCHDLASVRLLIQLTDREGSLVERESAALALGMLRRDDEAQRFGGKTLDVVRTKLIALYDDPSVPTRARSFALFALGMLADQPYATELGRHGQLTIKCLWERLRARDLPREHTVALLTALGMHTAARLPEQLADDLRRIVFGRNIYRREWSADERSHACTALGRLDTPSTLATLQRVVSDRRLPTPVRRAGFVALGQKAATLESEQRVLAAQAIERGVRSSSDALTRGLAHITLGRLLGADLRAGASAMLTRTDAASFLLGQARNAPADVHGFSVLALALSAREVNPDNPRAAAHASAAARLVLEEFQRAASNADRRAPLAVALGLIQAAEAAETLTTIVGDRRAPSELRGHAAIALGMLGRPERSTLAQLRQALNDHRSSSLSSKAALALSFISGRHDTRSLLDAMRKEPTQWVQAQIAAALGHLGDVEAVDAVLALARDPGRSDETRALAVASLGLLGDPHARPGLFCLTRDANYFALTEALAEVFTIL